METKKAVLYFTHQIRNKQEGNLMKKTNYEAMAQEIYEWCVARDLWDGCVIYFGGKAWNSHDDWGFKGKEFGTEIGNNLYEFKNKVCTDYFEYGNPDTLAMAFDGSDLYHVMNYYWEDKIYSKWFDEFNQMIEKYDCYLELGNSWNLTIVEN